MIVGRKEPVKVFTSSAIGSFTIQQNSFMAVRDTDTIVFPENIKLSKFLVLLKVIRN